METILQRPLCIDEVIHNIFDRLDLRCLKKCRHVCKLWNKIATKKIRLVLYGKYEENNPKLLENLLTSVSVSSFINVEVRGAFGKRISAILKQIGPRIQNFTITAGYQSVYFKLSALSNLDLHATQLMHVLETPFDKNIVFEAACKDIILLELAWKIISYQGDTFLAAMMNFCTKIQTIVIKSTQRNCHPPYFLYALLSTKNLQTIRELRLQQVQSVQQLTTLTFSSWSLKEFEVAIRGLQSIHLVRDILLRISPTLTSLVLEISSANDEYSRLFDDVQSDNWILPLSLKSLKHLVVISTGYEMFVTRSLILALRLPNLQQLSLRGFVGFNKFSMLMAGQFKDLQCLSLKTLEICNRNETFHDSELFLRLPNPFPNITTIKLRYPTIPVLYSIFKALQHVERLEILLEVSKDDQIIPWDSILGNAPLDLTNKKLLHYKGVPGFVFCPQELYLQEMQSLKSLKLVFAWNDTDSTDWMLTDHFVLNVLMHLKGLQYFHCSHHKFSQNCIDILSSVMHPFFNINVK